MGLQEFDTLTFAHAGARRDVFRRTSRPGVVIMHEPPAYLPHLFGEPGKPLSLPSMGAERARARLQRELDRVEEAWHRARVALDRGFLAVVSRPQAPPP